MPIWLTVLQAVPWTEVIRNAPKVAEGARKLWNAVADKKAPGAGVESPPTVIVSPQASPQERALAELQARVAAAEAANHDLHQQMLASSELLKALAEQNAELVRGLEACRRRMVRLTVLAGSAAVLAVAALGLLLGR